MPFTSRETIARMARDFMANQDHDVEPSSIICVAAYGGYFLQEIVLLGSVDETGMEDRLRSQAYDYFKTARAWTPYMLRQLPTTLSSLQALVYCVSLLSVSRTNITAEMSGLVSASTGTRRFRNCIYTCGCCLQTVQGFRIAQKNQQFQHRVHRCCC